MNTNVKYFLVTIDTEGDNVWNKMNSVTTENSKYIERFQNICEKYGFKPTYLVNYEMAMDLTFCNFVRKVLAREQCEIGLHIHSWNSPPIVPLTENDNKHHPLLIDFSKDIMAAKIEYMDKLLQERFERKIYSHRAGRWGVNDDYLELLEKYGYEIDCSIVPGVKFEKMSSNNLCTKVLDYSRYENNPFYPLKNKGFQSNLIELPMTVIQKYSPLICSLLTYIEKHFVWGYRALSKFGVKKLMWFRPRYSSLRDLKKIVKVHSSSNHPYIMFMLHSSELMEGGSPNFKFKKDIEKLYIDLDETFGLLRDMGYIGVTLKEFHDKYIKT